MEVLQFIVKYWAQFSVLIFGIGFLFKVYFDWNIRKKEIIFNHIKSTKVNELKAFYDSYIEFELLLKNIHYLTAQSNEKLEKELRQKLPETWKSFKKNMTFLSVFLSKKEYILFEELEKELGNIWLKLDFYEIDRRFEGLERDKDLVEELRHIRDVVFPTKLPAILKLIEKNLKKDFNIK